MYSLLGLTFLSTTLMCLFTHILSPFWIFFCITPIAGQHMLMYTPIWCWCRLFSITPIAKVPHQAHTHFFHFQYHTPSDMYFFNITLFNIIFFYITLADFSSFNVC